MAGTVRNVFRPGEPAVPRDKSLLHVLRRGRGEHKSRLHAPKLTAVKTGGGPSENKIDPALDQAVFEIYRVVFPGRELLWSQEAAGNDLLLRQRREKQGILMPSQHTVREPDPVPVQIQRRRLAGLRLGPGGVLKHTVPEFQPVPVHKQGISPEGPVRPPVRVGHLREESRRPGLPLKHQIALMNMILFQFTSPSGGSRWHRSSSHPSHRSPSSSAAAASS